MNFHDLINYCDRLSFLERINLTYYARDIERAGYYIKPGNVFKFFFWQNGNMEYCKVTPSETLYLSFEDFFDELPVETKENIIFHLDIFKSKSRVT